MKMIKPLAMADASLVSSTLPEDDYPGWNAATSYTIGTRCIRATTHTVYEAITGGVNATPPEEALGGDTPQWIAVKSTNRWAMFNDSINDASTSTENIVVELALNGAEGLAVMGAVGESITVSVADNVSSTVIFTTEIELDRSIVTDFYDWFFVPAEQAGQMVVVDLPGWYTDTTATVTIAATATRASCGVLKFGEVKDIGAAEYGAKLSMVDYSITEADSFGYLQIVERGYIYTLSVKLIVPKAAFRAVSAVLSDARATPTVYIPVTDDNDLDPLVTYGISNDFSIDIAYPDTYYCTLEVRGMM